MKKNNPEYKIRKGEREIKEPSDIEKIISGSEVCRIALADKNIPYIVTMNFGYSGSPVSRLFFHCAREGRKIDMIRKNNYVCFQMDSDRKLIMGKEACDFSMGYSSTIGWGYIYIIDNEEEKREGLNIIMNHYTDIEEFRYEPEVLKKTLVLRLDIVYLTCKRHLV